MTNTQELIDQLPRVIKLEGYEYNLTIQAYEDKWMAAYRYYTSSLDNMVAECDTLYDCLEDLVKKFGEFKHNGIR